jgi:hypothetical protein
LEEIAEYLEFMEKKMALENAEGGNVNFPVKEEKWLES